MTFLRQALLGGIFATVAFTQNAEKTFYFTHVDSPAALQDITNVMRSTGDIRDVTPDSAKHAINVKGNEEQLAMAAWLTAGLDNPRTAPGFSEKAFSDPHAPLAQIYYLRYVATPQEMQEVINAVRSLADMQRVFPVMAVKAIVMRGNPAQIKATDWLLGHLDQPAGADPVAAEDYPLTEPEWVPRSGTQVLRVAPLNRANTPQAVQELVNCTRAVSDLQRLYPIPSRRVVTMRGPEEQIAMAKWIIQQLDGPQGSGTRETKAGSSEVVQVTYLAPGDKLQLSQTVSSIQRATNMQRVIPFSTQNAVVMRGTPTQVAQAAAAIHGN